MWRRCRGDEYESRLKSLEYGSHLLSLEHFTRSEVNRRRYDVVLRYDGISWCCVSLTVEDLHCNDDTSTGLPIYKPRQKRGYKPEEPDSPQAIDCNCTEHMT